MLSEISEHRGAVLPATVKTLWSVTLRRGGGGRRRKPGTLTTLESAPQRARPGFADASRGGSVRGPSVVPRTSPGQPALWGQTAPWRETHERFFGDTGILIGSKWPKNFFKKTLLNRFLTFTRNYFAALMLRGFPSVICGKEAKRRVCLGRLSIWSMGQGICLRKQF